MTSEPESEPPISASEEMLDDLDVFIDMYNDPRVLWFKERILAFIGIDDDSLFYNMLDEGDAKAKFGRYITGTIKPNEIDLDKRMMYVSKVIADKLIHEDKEFTEWSKFSFCFNTFMYLICF